MNLRRLVFNKGLPQNLRPRDPSPASVQQDIDHAFETAHSYLAKLPGGDTSWLRGKNVLEIGPGIHYGVPLILACFGARVAVADRFPPGWQPAYHPVFYSQLLDRFAGEFPAIDPSPLRAAVKDQTSLNDHLTEIKTPVERIPRRKRNGYDVIFSNAVLEHLFLPFRAIRRLAWVTRPGGLGFHQVDFRDHRDFSRPLEYLLLSRVRFWKVFYWSHGECGNRLRPGGFSRIFTRSGFTIRDFEVNMHAADAYLNEFMPRLRKSSSTYAGCPETELKKLSGCFHLVKT